MRKNNQNKTKNPLWKVVEETGKPSSADFRAAEHEEEAG